MGLFNRNKSEPKTQASEFYNYVEMNPETAWVTKYLKSNDTLNGVRAETDIKLGNGPIANFTMEQFRAYIHELFGRYVGVADAQEGQLLHTIIDYVPEDITMKRIWARQGTKNRWAVQWRNGPVYRAAELTEALATLLKNNPKLNERYKKNMAVEGEHSV